jgi:septal ring factor EnvC (AmiA/AmiB activator)
MSATAVIAFALGMGFLARNEVQTNTQFDVAHDSLNLTRSQIKMTVSHLASIRRDLFMIDGQAQQTATTLATDTTQLHEVQAALAEAQTRVSTQGSDITALQSCLGGVEQALNALSVGDQGSALAALVAVSTSCQNAVTADG